MLGYLLVYLYIGIVSSSLNRVANSVQFKGFIYPYAIFVQTPINSISKIILFQKVSSQQIYPNLTSKDLQYLDQYKHLQSFMIPGNYSQQPAIIVKDNLFIVKNITLNSILTITYLKNPHEHKFYQYHNVSDSSKNFFSFFKIQQLQKNSKVKKKGKYFYQVSELWRSWVFVKYQERNTRDESDDEGGNQYKDISSGDEFILKIKRQPSNNMLQKEFVFIKQYFVEGEVNSILLQKHTTRLILELIIVSDYKICVFHISNQLVVNFKYCSVKKDKIKEVVHLKNSNIVIFYESRSNSQNLIEGGDKVSEDKFEIQTLEEHTKTSCQVILPVPTKGSYRFKKVVRNRIVSCSENQCHSFSFRCEAVFGFQQQMLQVDNIYYERIDHPYLEFIYSSVNFQSNGKVYSFVECDEPKYLIPNLNLCLKPQAKNHNFLVDKYSNMTCYQCSDLPKAYYKNQTCQFVPNHEIQYFEQQVYVQKQKFLLHYSKYLSGITSNCEPKLQCTLDNYFAYSYAKIRQSDDLLANASCELLIPVQTHSDFIIETTYNSQFSLKLCISQTQESPLTCIVQNSPHIKRRFRIRAKNYILMVLTAKGGGPNEIQYRIINIQQQQVYKVSLFLKRTLTCISVIVIVVLLILVLRDRAIAQMTNWGWIQYTPSGNYPLLEAELKLKIKYNLEKKFIKQYPYVTPSNPKRQSQQSKQCVFCLFEFNQNQQIFQIYCRHQFHKSCLSEWFQIQPNSDKCPICKRQFILQNVVEFNSGNYEFNKKIFEEMQQVI